MIKKIYQLSIITLIAFIISVSLFAWFNPRKVRQWNLRYNEHECHEIELRIEEVNAKTRLTQALRVSDNFKKYNR